MPVPPEMIPSAMTLTPEDIDKQNSYFILLCMDEKNGVSITLR